MDFRDIMESLDLAFKVAHKVEDIKYEDELFKILFDQIEDKILYIDSNIFLAKPDKYISRFFNELERHESIKIVMPSEQYEEIYSLKNSEDVLKSKSARDAFRRIETLIDSKKLDLPKLSDNPTKSSYADPIFIKMIIENLRNEQKVFFITEDKDLKIRLKSNIEQENLDDVNIVICSFQAMLQDKNKIVDEEREKIKKEKQKQKEADELFEKIEKGSLAEKVVENTIVKWLK